MQDVRNAIHIGLTAILAWLAFYFELSTSLFTTDRGFGYMAQLASQHTWAVVFLAGANVGIIGLITHRAVVRLTSALVIATIHGIFAGCLILSTASVWSGTYAIIAAMGYYLAYHRARAGL